MDLKQETGGEESTQENSVIHWQMVRTSSKVEEAVTPESNFLCALHKVLTLYIQCIDFKELQGF